MHVVGDESPIDPWRETGHGITVIPFCYATQLAKNTIGDIFNKVWLRWYSVLGPPGPGAGHGFGGFQETQGSRGESIFCYTNYRQKDWNDDFPDEALVVDFDVGSVGGSSSLGNSPDKW
jgi:hypothetical protein